MKEMNACLKEFYVSCIRIVGGFSKSTTMNAIKQYLVLNTPAPATFENNFALSTVSMEQIMNPPSLIYSKYSKTVLFHSVKINPIELF